jgi:hypothetical protein
LPAALRAAAAACCRRNSRGFEVPPRAHALTAADTRKAPPSSSASISWMSTGGTGRTRAGTARRGCPSRHRWPHRCR